MYLYIENLHSYQKQSQRLRRILLEVAKLTECDFQMCSADLIAISERHEVDVNAVIVLHRGIRLLVGALQGHEQDRVTLVSEAFGVNIYSKLVFGFYLDTQRHALSLLQHPRQKDVVCKKSGRCKAGEFTLTQSNLQAEIEVLNGLLRITEQEFRQERESTAALRLELETLTASFEMYKRNTFSSSGNSTSAMQRMKRWITDTGLPAEHPLGQFQYDPTFVKSYRNLPEHVQTATKESLFQFVLHDPLTVRRILDVKRVVRNPGNLKHAVHDWVCDVRNTTYRIVFRKDKSTGTIRLLYVGEHSDFY